MSTPCYQNTPLVAGEFYHFFNRANSQTDKLFYQERNYSYFLRLWTDYMNRHFDVWSYCLIPNHFHFLVHVREVDLPCPAIESWRRLAISYTQAINKQENRRGSLFQEHPKYLLVSTDAHLMSLVRYIHNNPLHHGLTEQLETWRYSSYSAFFSSTLSRVKCPEVIALFGSIAAFKAFHQQKDNFNQEIDYCLIDV
jgi:putative transposase